MTKRTSPIKALHPSRVGSSVLRLVASFGLCAGLVGSAGAESPSVTDLSNVNVEIIESGDIVEALAIPRGTKVRAGARPRVRLPVYFEFNSAELKPEAMRLLQKVGKALSASDLESFNFSIEGHTDSVGDESFNTNLSERRAEMVRLFLQGRGVSEDRLKSVGRGEADPVDTNVTDEGRKHNRRVEIINMGSDS